MDCDFLYMESYLEGLGKGLMLDIYDEIKRNCYSVLSSAVHISVVGWSVFFLRLPAFVKFFLNSCL